MQKKELLSGNEALAESALLAGCSYFFGYPITPSTEVLERMAVRLPQVGGEFMQAESELAAINMVYGAASAGGIVMTATSSPGYSLMQEGVSFLASAELPCLLVNVMRVGPGLGTLPPSQGDYNQAVKGGGNGDYRLLVIAPWSVQEIAELTSEGFALANKYRIPVLLLLDGMLGQMMEGVSLPVEKKDRRILHWNVRGGCGADRRVITSAPLNHQELIKLNQRLQKKYQKLQEEETKWEILSDYPEENSRDFLVVAFGSAARIAKDAIDTLNERGYSLSLFRPITLWPFPREALREEAKRAKKILVVEMNAGQMLDDVKISLPDKEILFFGQPAAGAPVSEEITCFIEAQLEEGKYGTL